MKKPILINYLMVVLSVLVFSPIKYAFAEQADVRSQQCLLEVREAMGREEIKQLYAGDQKRVNEICKRGDVESAIRVVEWIGTMNSCVQELDTHIKTNKLNVAKDVYSRAMSQCRRGDLKKAINEVSVAPPKIPAQITSFVANTSKVKKGNAVILSWRTANANTIMFGEYGAGEFEEVQASGSQSVSPDKTTTYVLMVGQSTKGPAAMKSKTLRVTVTKPEKGTCSIEGKLEGKWRQPIKEHPQGPSSIWTVTVGLYVVGSDRQFPSEGASVSDQGIYRFKDVAAENEYRIKPTWGSSPQDGYVSCSAGEIHTGPKFTITGGPLID